MELLLIGAIKKDTPERVVESLVVHVRRCGKIAWFVARAVATGGPSRTEVDVRDQRPLFLLKRLHLTFG